MDAYRIPGSQTTFEDIPDVEAYENTTMTSQGNVLSNSNGFVFYLYKLKPRTFQIIEP